MVELMKSRLYGNHDNHLTTKCFLPLLVKMLSKITQFQMLPESTIQLQNQNLCEVIVLSLLILNNIISIGLGLPDFRERQVEK